MKTVKIEKKTRGFELLAYSPYNDVNKNETNKCPTTYITIITT